MVWSCCFLLLNPLWETHWLEFGVGFWLLIMQYILIIYHPWYNHELCSCEFSSMEFPIHLRILWGFCLLDCFWILKDTDILYDEFDPYTDFWRTFWRVVYSATVWRPEIITEEYSWSLNWLLCIGKRYYGEGEFSYKCLWVNLKVFQPREHKKPKTEK